MPWFGTWQPRDTSRKPILVCGAGPDLASAKISALDRLQRASRDIGDPSQVTLLPAHDPRSVLWRTMIGDASTPNQIAQGIALCVAVGHLYDPAIYREAIKRFLAFMDLQINVGMMSVRHGSRVISEFCGNSHLWIWLDAYAYARWVAVKTLDSSLLDATQELWSRFIHYASLAGTPDGHLLCAGPRAWSRPDPNKPAPKKFSWQSSAGDAIYCDLLLPSLKWKNARLAGNDMIGARIVRDLLARRQLSVKPSKEMPASTDPITIARNGNDIAVWLESCSNMTRPGPLWWSIYRSNETKILYGVQPENSEPKYGIHDALYSHPRDDRRWQLKHRTQQAERNQA